MPQNTIKGELEEKTSVGFSDKSSGGRKAKLYNLDVIISVCYRVHSQNGIIFRKWATSVLREYMLKGYKNNQKNDIFVLVTNALQKSYNKMSEKLTK